MHNVLGYGDELDRRYRGYITPSGGTTTPVDAQYDADRFSSKNMFLTSGPQHAHRSPKTDSRHSSSSRSGYQTTSYVAALRRQEGTVWCDRAQPEDPAVVVQLRAAKMRAASMMEAASRTPRNVGTGVSIAGKVAARIRHYGKPAVIGYAPEESHVSFAGVRSSLSDTEVSRSSTEDSNK